MLVKDIIKHINQISSATHQPDVGGSQYRLKRIKNYSDVIEVTEGEKRISVYGTTLRGADLNWFEWQLIRRAFTRKFKEIKYDRAIADRKNRRSAALDKVLTRELQEI